jgi:hypothetical protein
MSELWEPRISSYFEIYSQNNSNSSETL